MVSIISKAGPLKLETEKVILSKNKSSKISLTNDQTSKAEFPKVYGIGMKGELSGSTHLRKVPI